MNLPCGQLRRVQIAEREPYAADIELPGRAFGDGAHFIIENAQNRASDRPADWHRRDRQANPAAPVKQVVKVVFSVGP